MTTSPASSSEPVLKEIETIIAEVLETSVIFDDLEIHPAQSLTDDLGLESIDLVTIGLMLTERYGDQVNLAAYLADRDIDDVITMTVGDLVQFVDRKLASGAAGER